MMLSSRRWMLMMSSYAKSLGIEIISKTLTQRNWSSGSIANRIPMG